MLKSIGYTGYARLLLSLATGRSVASVDATIVKRVQTALARPSGSDRSAGLAAIFRLQWRQRSADPSLSLPADGDAALDVLLRRWDLRPFLCNLGISTQTDKENSPPSNPPADPPDPSPPAAASTSFDAPPPFTDTDMMRFELMHLQQETRALALCTAQLAVRGGVSYLA